MKSALLLTSLCLASPALAQDVDPSEALSVEVLVERDRWYVGEYVTGTLRVRVHDRTFLQEHVVQPYQRELDVPLRLVAPWLEGRNVDPASQHLDTRSVAMNDGVCGFRKAGDALDVTFRFAPSSPQSIDLSTTLEMIVAAEFREDFVEGRVAIDPRPVRLAFPGPEIEILPVPEDGRPDRYSGGVGAFTIAARLAGADPERPGVLRLLITVAAPAAADDVSLPALTELEGVHVIGSRAMSAAALQDGWAKTYLYELARTDPSVKRIPPIPFTFFDPISEQFRTIHTEPVALPPARREAGSGAASVAPASPTDEGHGEGEDGGDLVLPVALLLVVVLVGVLLARRRAGTQDPEQLAMERAAHDARVAMGVPGADPGEVLTRFLAHRLDCAPAAVVTPELARRLISAGDAPRDAETTAALLERLVAARYGGVPPTAEDLSAVRIEIERHAA